MVFYLVILNNKNIIFSFKKITTVKPLFFKYKSIADHRPDIWEYEHLQSVTEVK